MSIADKFHALQFEIVTSRTVDEIRQVCSQAAEYAVGRVIEQGLSDDGLSINYVVQSWSRMKIGNFVIDIKELEDGKRNVALYVDWYFTEQEALLYFIPLGPKTSPAYKSVKEFSEFARQRLSETSPQYT